jgi:hypothetical protein
MAKIIATVPLKGLSTGARKISFEVDGVKGESCANMTAMFEQALSCVPAEQERKAEYYETEERREFLNEGGS